jgi:hypothetical protein
MKILRRLCLRLIPKYRSLEKRFVRYNEADRLIRESLGKSPDQQWHIAQEEDFNGVAGWVHIERRVRITE